MYNLAAAGEHKIQYMYSCGQIREPTDANPLIWSGPLLLACESPPTLNVPAIPQYQRRGLIEACNTSASGV